MRLTLGDIKTITRNATDDTQIRATFHRGPEEAYFPAVACYWDKNEPATIWLEIPEGYKVMAKFDSSDASVHCSSTGEKSLK